MQMNILEMLKSATGPDRELDAEIGKFAGKHNARIIPHHELTRPIHHSPYWVGGPSANAYYLPPYTYSIDAALALVERMLPGWHYTVASCHTDFKMRPWADVASPCFIDSDQGECFESDGATPALAILTALFTALATKDTPHADK